MTSKQTEKAAVSRTRPSAADQAAASDEAGGSRARREEFYIHPEILLGGAGYRRVPPAGDSASGT